MPGVALLGMNLGPLNSSGCGPPFFSYLGIFEIFMWGWGDSRTNRALALHVTDLGFIFSTLYTSTEFTGSDP